MTLFCFKSEEEALSQKGLGEAFLGAPLIGATEKWDDFHARESERS